MSDPDEISTFWNCPFCGEFDCDIDHGDPNEGDPDEGDVSIWGYDGDSL